MATRTLNSSQRQRIAKEMVGLRLQPSSANNRRALEVSFNLQALELDPQSQLFLDVRSGYQEQRFQLNLDETSHLLELDTSMARETLASRFIVSQRDQNGVPVIKAASVWILLEPESGKSTLESPLVVRPDPNLQVPWRLDFSSGDVQVVVSNRANLWSAGLKGSPTFKATIAGPIVFQIALYLIESGESVEGAALEKWIEILKPFGLDAETMRSDADYPERFNDAMLISERFQQDRGVLDQLISALEVSENGI